MTDQTRWGIPEIQLKNKAIKYQKDLVAKAMESVVKMDQESLEDLMTLIEAEYEQKYGENKANKVVLQNDSNVSGFMEHGPWNCGTPMELFFRPRNRYI